VYVRVENVTMKIDDINQKENQLKLSMQTLEVRIANLEELGKPIWGVTICCAAPPCPSTR